ncbi:SH3 domain-containing protein [Streptomyces sp. NPDC087903]|uniref:SH3 domain-containing protein n=1 Tax=Streptomyces sp. NPDC087903 TaxID=3365819 RepID=UPI0038193703
MPTRTLARAALVGAGALTLLGSLTATASAGSPTAGTAVVASTAGQGSAHVLAAPYAVEPYETVNIRKGPARSYDKVGSVVANQPRGAYCWTHGETISDHGYTNDVWVQLVEGYVSAVYLKGNEYGDLPASATC